MGTGYQFRQEKTGSVLKGFGGVFMAFVEGICLPEKIVFGSPCGICKSLAGRQMPFLDSPNVTLHGHLEYPARSREHPASQKIEG